MGVRRILACLASAAAARHSLLQDALEIRYLPNGGLLAKGVTQWLTSDVPEFPHLAQLVFTSGFSRAIATITQGRRPLLDWTSQKARGQGVFVYEAEVNSGDTPAEFERDVNRTLLVFEAMTGFPVSESVQTPLSTESDSKIRVGVKTHDDRLCSNTMAKLYRTLPCRAASGMVPAVGHLLQLGDYRSLSILIEGRGDEEARLRFDVEVYLERPKENSIDMILGHPPCTAAHNTFQLIHFANGTDSLVDRSHPETPHMVTARSLLSNAGLEEGSHRRNLFHSGTNSVRTHSNARYGNIKIPKGSHARLFDRLPSWARPHRIRSQSEFGKCVKGVRVNTITRERGHPHWMMEAMLKETTGEDCHLQVPLRHKFPQWPNYIWVTVGGFDTDSSWIVEEKTGRISVSAPDSWLLAPFIDICEWRLLTSHVNCSGLLQCDCLGMPLPNVAVQSQCEKPSVFQRHLTNLGVIQNSQTCSLR